MDFSISSNSLAFAVQNISIDFASIDVSFISLKIILPVLYNLLKSGGRAVCLIKPQFEAGKENVGKKGVVRDKNIHVDVINNVIGYIKDAPFSLIGLDYSPVKGPEGNIEYLAYIEKSYVEVALPTAQSVVEASHLELDK